MPRTEQEIAGKQQALCIRLGRITANYEYEKAAIMAEFRALDAELADARIEESKKAPDTLRRDIDALTAKLAALTAANDTKETTT